MKILITGGAGMVGRNIRENLDLTAHEILAPSRQELDLLDGKRVRQWIGDHRPEMIIHCAGRVGGIQANMSYPCDFLLENIEMGKSVIWSAAELKIPKLINMGSSCMYPRGHQDALREEMVMKGELEPTNEGYAIAKVMAQRLCAYIGKQFGLSYKTLIPCNLYGRHDSFDPARSHLIPAVIYKLEKAKRSGAREVEIWGDGEARREFMYAGDLADFVAFAIPRYAELPDLLNVGLGYDYTIKEYYRAAAEAVGFNGGFKHDLTKPVGMARKLVSVERLSAFGWKAPTDLVTGLKRIFEFYLEQGGLNGKN